MMKIISTVFILSVVVSISVPAVFPETVPEEVQAVQSSSDSIYSYDDNDLPEVFFFPKERARWDGSKVTMREWYMLTDLQKEKFITEYLWQLQIDNRIGFDIIGSDYLKALNIFSYYSDDKALREPSTKFIDILLNGQGKVLESGRQKR